MNNIYKGKTILITGGTGSLGKSLVQNILSNHNEVDRVIVFSRNEQQQYLMAQEFPKAQFPQIRFIVGDIRDYDRVKRALHKVDYVIHSAALKHVPITEDNPMECVKTNILGAENLINACLETDVERVVALSTDKACAPINLYGATKLASDKLFIAANNLTGDNPIKFSVVRFGNIFGSIGSVIPYFLSKKMEGILPVTDPRMTRFGISLQQGVDMVMHALENAWGGELFVPKIPSFKLTELANAIDPACEQKIIGIRPGEKLHEEMITKSDAMHTYDLGDHYVILPSTANWKVSEFVKAFAAKKVNEDFYYNSKENTEWLTVQDLEEIVKGIEKKSV